MQSPSANHVPGQMAEKLLDMVWQLTMPADAPPELLEADAMAEVLRQYEDDQARARERGGGCMGGGERG